jgi:GR25 family glycosyltransferase involved in LPS biosynthesis
MNTQKRKKSRVRTKNITYKMGGSSGENDLTFVSSRGILKSCDVIPSNITSSIKNAPIDISAIKDGSTVYVHGSGIPDFVGKLDSIKAKFILVSGDCDEDIPDAVFPSVPDFERFIASDKIIHWFSQNAVRKHDKLTIIPIGLDYHSISKSSAFFGEQMLVSDQEKELMSVKNSAKPFSERVNKYVCYSNFHLNNSDSERINAVNKIPKDLVFYEPSQITRTETWKNQATYSFVLSPRGVGYDCHRTWEALCLGCIPIVKESPINSVYDDLPVLIINDWSDLTKELLENTIKSFSQKTFSYDKLKLQYWMKLINSKKPIAGGKKSGSIKKNKPINKKRYRKSINRFRGGNQYGHDIKILIVHYKKLTDRKNKIIEQLDKYNLKNYEFVEIDRDELDKQNTNIFSNTYTNVMKAITLSHIHCYNEIADKYEFALILEDDAIFKDNFFENLLKYLQELPKDYDMLFIGGCGNLHIKHNELIEGKHVYEKGHEKTDSGGMGASRCTDSYIVNKKCAIKIREYLKKLRDKINTPIDFFLNTVIKDNSFKIYWGEPSLISQGSESGQMQGSYDK